MRRRQGDCRQRLQRYQGYRARVQKVLDSYNGRAANYNQQIHEIKCDVDPNRHAVYDYLCHDVSPKVERLMLKCHALLESRLALGAFFGAAGFDIISLVVKEMRRWSSVRWLASWSGSARACVNSLFAVGGTVGETTVAGTLTAADAELAATGGLAQTYAAGILGAWARRSAAGASGSLLVYCAWEVMKKAIKDTIIDKTVLARLEQWQKDSVACATEIVTLERSTAAQLAIFDIPPVF